VLGIERVLCVVNGWFIEMDRDPEGNVPCFGGTCSNYYDKGTLRSCNVLHTANGNNSPLLDGIKVSREIKPHKSRLLIHSGHRMEYRVSSDGRLALFCKSVAVFLAQGVAKV
jgi:hypothetical protein